MKKKKFLFIIGLMSLMMVSCEDSYELAEEAGFMPRWFMADEMNEGSLQIIGPEWLAFDQTSKDDWLLAVQPRTVLQGGSPLEILETPYPVTEEGILHIKTNHGEIPVGVGNLTVSYTYMGKELELQSWRGLFLNIEVIPDEDQTPEEYSEGLTEDVTGISYNFYQRGMIKYTLCDGTIPLKSVERPFRVFDSKVK